MNENKIIMGIAVILVIVAIYDLDMPLFTTSSDEIKPIEIHKNVQESDDPVEELKFILSENKTDVIPLNNSNDSIEEFPKNCLLWFDGCNVCGVVNNLLTNCTQKTCEHHNESKCQQYKSPNKEPIYYKTYNPGYTVAPTIN